MPIPEFITTLRAKIGNDPLWLSGVSAVVVDDSGRLLLTRRRDNGLWAVVSGVLEPGEEPGPAALREISEETGVDAELVRLTSVDVTEPITYPNGDRTQYIDICFLARYVAGQARVADDENLDVQWFERTALPTDITATSTLRIAKALDHGPEAWFRR